MTLRRFTQSAPMAASVMYRSPTRRPEEQMHVVVVQ